MKSLFVVYSQIAEGENDSTVKINRVSDPEDTEGGAIGLVEEGDSIEIDIPNRTIHLAVSDDELASRRAVMEAKGVDAWKHR